MKVIKVVLKQNSKLVSTFAMSKWQKEYAEGVETKPDAGYLFAYSKKDLQKAERDMGAGINSQYWLAEAKVVGRIRSYDIDTCSSFWHGFWGVFSLCLQDKAADYLLCSSITLVKQLK